MKNNPLVMALLVAVCGVAALVLGLALTFEMHFRQVRQLQYAIAAEQNNRAVIAEAIREANDYSKSHPSIDPLLAKYGAKAGQGPAKTPGK